jgi:hypothetical protein
LPTLPYAPYPYYGAPYYPAVVAPEVVVGGGFGFYGHGGGYHR